MLCPETVGKRVPVFDRAPFLLLVTSDVLNSLIYSGSTRIDTLFDVANPLDPST